MIFSNKFEFFLETFFSYKSSETWIRRLRFRRGVSTDRRTTPDGVIPSLSRRSTGRRGSHDIRRRRTFCCGSPEIHKGVVSAFNKGSHDIQHSDIQHNGIQHNNKLNTTLSIMAECAYAERHLC